MTIWSRTCFIIDTLERHGAQKQLLLMARYLRDRGLPPFQLIVFREPLTLREEFREAGVEPVLVRKAKAIDLPFMGNLIRTLRRMRPTVVVTFLITPDLWGRVAAIVARVPVVGSSVRDIPRDHGAIRDKVLVALDRRSDFIVSNSKKAAEVTCVRSKVGADKVSVIYNGIESDGPSPVRPAPEPEGAEKAIGIVARLVPAKDISTLLRAFARVVQATPARLMIVGDGPLRRQLEEEAADLKVADRVLFMGERADAKELMKQFDVGVLSSVYEGLSNVLMEYMLNARAVVATNVAGNPELVEDGVTGYLFEPGDDAALAARLVELLASPERRIRMGEKGREKMVGSFSVEKMVERWGEALGAFAQH
jgi:glycosyltransferase involved in cell wall biosynthesis